MEIWDYGTVVSKFALYIGILFATGSVFYSLFFDTPATKKLVRISKLIFYFCLLAILATLAGFGFRGVALAGELSGFFNPEMYSILWQTPVKYTFTMRLLGLSLMLMGIFLAKYGLLFQVIGSLIAIGSFSLTGHISQLDHVFFAILLFTHLVFLALWIGVLIPLYRLSKTGRFMEPTANIAHRFGQSAVFFVPVLVGAGLWLAYQLVGTIDNLIGTSYGVNLILKVGLVGIILTFAAVNKLKFVPSMQSGIQKAREDFNRSLSVETFLILIVLLATSVLTSVQNLPGDG